MVADYSNEKWLRAQFEKPLTTPSTVAQQLGCNERTVRRWMKHFGISTRPIAETASLAQAREDDLSPHQYALIEGGLLASGSLQSRSEFSARYVQVTKQEALLGWMRAELDMDDRDPLKAERPDRGGVCYSWSSDTFLALKRLHDTWYSTGSKVIPPSLNLDAKCCLVSGGGRTGAE